MRTQPSLVRPLGKAIAMGRELSAPIDVQIELTNSCNQQCGHCYNTWRMNPDAFDESRTLSRPQLQQIVEELVKNQVPSITITGGEPFAARDRLFYLLDLAREARLHVSLNTNLSLTTTEDLAKLSKEPCVPLLVSLLSANPDEHARLAGVSRETHSHVVAQIAASAARGIPVSINMVLMPKNLHGMSELAVLAKKLGVRTFCATKALPNGSSKSRAHLLTKDQVLWSLEKLIELERSLGLAVDILGCYPKCLLLGTPAYQRFYHRVCVAGKTTVTIGSEGAIRPCSHLAETCGNIFTSSLQEIWTKMAAWRSYNSLPTICRECTIVKCCTGGCRVNALAPGFRRMDLHADPMRLTRSHAPIRPSESKSTAHTIPSLVIVYPKLSFRNETFGAMVYRTNPWAFLLANHRLASFLRRMKVRGSFSLTSFLNESGARTTVHHNKVTSLYFRLLNKGLLVPID